MAADTEDNKIIYILADTINSFREPIIIIAMVLGFGLIAKSLYQAATMDMNPGGSRTSKVMVGTMFFVGVMLFNITQFFSIGAQTVFQSNYSIISEVNPNPSDQMATATWFVTTVVQVTGMIGMIKAFTTALKPEEQGGGFASSIKIFIAASLALNINHLLCAIQKTFSSTAIGDAISKMSVC